MAQEDAALLFEVVGRCGVTDGIAARMLSVLSKGVSRGAAAYLEFGLWWRGLSQERLEQVLRALAQCGELGTVVMVLGHRLEAEPHENEAWSTLVSETLVRPELVRASGMANHYWQKLASDFAKVQPKAIAAAIFRTHGESRVGDSWFIQFSSASAVLLDTAARNASMP